MDLKPSAPTRRVGASRGLLVALFGGLVAACVVAGMRNADCALLAMRAGAASGLFERHPEVAQTAGLIAQSDETCAFVVESMLDDAEREATRASSLREAAAARDLVLRAIPARPAAARERLLLGRSAALLGEARARWERPLVLASRAAPGSSLAPELLATRYFAEWSRLPANERSRALEIARAAFRDERSVGRLFPTAVSAVGGATAASLLPEDPRVLQAAIDSISPAADPGFLASLQKRLARLESAGRPAETSGPRS
jgi:hypothetical protein